MTEITPAVQIRGEGARLTVNVDYRFQNLYYARDSEDWTTNQQLQADATAELVRHILFVDTTAALRQENINDTGEVTADNTNVSNNRTDVKSFSFSPFVVHKFGTFADSETRYVYNQISNEGASSESSSNGVFFRLTSGRQFTRLPWEVTYHRRKID